MYYVGIDAGSVFTKVVVMDEEGIVSYDIRPSGRNYRDSIMFSLEDALSKAGVNKDQIYEVTVTGHGGEASPVAGEYASDISCMAKGVGFLFPQARTLIEIGGQVSKVVSISNGRVVRFVAGDRCAGGSGRFLQVLSKILDLSFEEMSKRALNPVKRIKFSTGCAVFTETEVISRIAEGSRIDEIIAGVRESMANKIISMANRIGIEKECVVCGGGAKDIGLVKTMEEKLGINLFVPFEPIICGALGAALLSRDKC